MRTLIERYAWADDPALDLTWCVSVIEGSDEAAVVRAFGGEPDRPAVMTFREADADAGEHFGEYTNLVVVRIARHVVTMDGYGYGGAVPEIARRASAGGGRYFSFHIDMNGNGRIVQAENGTVTAFFEPLFVNDRDLSHPWRLSARTPPGDMSGGHGATDRRRVRPGLAGHDAADLPCPRPRRVAQERSARP